MTGKTVETGTQQLIERAQAGDEQALADLFNSYKERLSRMIRLRLDQRVKSRIDEDDVLQDVFIELTRRLREYSQATELPFFLWLRLTTGEILIDLHRKHLGAEMRTVHRELRIHRKVPNASTFFLASKLAGQFTSVDRNLIREEVLQKLENAINQMDEGDREVLAMRHFEELSADDIAITLGLTRSGVLKRLTRSLRKLREAIRSETDVRL